MGKQDCTDRVEVVCKTTYDQKCEKVKEPSCRIEKKTQCRDVVHQICKQIPVHPYTCNPKKHEHSKKHSKGATHSTEHDSEDYSPEDVSEDYWPEDVSEDHLQKRSVMHIVNKLDKLSEKIYKKTKKGEQSPKKHKPVEYTT